MTRKDYVLLAQHIAGIHDDRARTLAAIAVADACAADNSRFDRARFYLACQASLQSIVA